MKRSEIINRLSEIIDAKTYLEIGVRIHAHNFDKINIDHKVGVDPCLEAFDREPTFKLTSDDFFKKNTETFDIIFIDGLHESKQVEVDILNSLDVLNQGGYIVCHDMNPTVYERQLPIDDPKRKEYISKGKKNNDLSCCLWNGDCWKAFVKLRMYRDDLSMVTLNTDFGVGIITRGKQNKLNIKHSEITYENFAKNRVEWINLTDPSDYFHL